MEMVCGSAQSPLVSAAGRMGHGLRSGYHSLPVYGTPPVRRRTSLLDCRRLLSARSALETVALLDRPQRDRSEAGDLDCAPDPDPVKPGPARRYPARAALALLAAGIGHHLHGRDHP